MAQKRKHRDNLVETAMRLFRRQGYSATGLVQITETSGAPKGSLYHYFPHGKEELGAEAVRLASTQVADMLSESLKSTTSFAGFVEAVTRTYAGWMADGDYRSGCPIATTVLECAPESASITSAGQEGFDRWTSIATQALLRDGVEAGQAEKTAIAFISALEGALILSRVRKSALPLEAVAAHFSSYVASRDSSVG